MAAEQSGSGSSGSGSDPQTGSVYVAVNGGSGSVSREEFTAHLVFLWNPGTR